MRLLHPAAILSFSLLAMACGGDNGSAADSSATINAAASAEGAPAPESRSVGPDSADIPAGLMKAAFDVEGMTCGGCVLGTRMALAKVSGVRTAGAAYDEETKKGTAWAIYDPATATQVQLMAAIRKLGYKPTPISE